MIKIYYVNFVKLFSHLLRLRKPPCCFTLPTFAPVSFDCDLCDCGQISENIFFFLNLLMQKIFFYKNQWFQLLSIKNNWIISLFLISIILHSLSLGHFIMSSFCWQKKNNPWLSVKTLLLHLTKSPNARKFCFWGCCLSFFRFFRFHFFGLLRPLLQICKVWFTQTPAKCTNQVTLSNEHMNYLYRA